MSADDITLWIWLSPWVVFLVWELWILLRRKKGYPDRTISMVAKEKGPHLTAFVYLWASQPAHWWWNATTWGPMWLGIIFWAIPLGLLGWDVATWREDAAGWPRWKRIARHPLLWVVLGALAGRFLFAQKG